MTASSKKKQLIDPLYQKFTRSVIRALGSTAFYEFFMDSLAHADNEFQFSNRRLEKTVDLEWVDAIEERLEAFQNVISMPRHVIHEEELVVNVANARKAGADVVRHLSQHANQVDKFDVDTGDVQPNRLMQKYREDSWGMYENRLVFTTMEMAYQFVKLRHDALFSAMGDEFGAKLRLRSDMDSAVEAVHMEMFLHIKDTESALETDEKNHETFSRISRIYRVLTMCMNSQFSQQMARLSRVKGTITKTNVLKKNPMYRKILDLYEFLRNYDDVGYTIRVVEQNPTINEQLQQDIFHNILFNYLILKGYLETEKDRQLPKPLKERKRVLKPKVVKEIIEELTEDYDLPDVEIRKVLIEELTKAQLMQEEAAERRRLVEEQAQRKREEAERLRQEREAEKERIRKEKEAEKERIRQEKQAEEERLRNERMNRQQEDRRRSKIFKKELAFFTEHLQDRLDAREAVLAKERKEKQDFEDAARLLEEAEERRREAAEREKLRKQEEKERLRREKRLAKERALQEELSRKEQERQAKLAEEERLMREQQEKEEAEQRRLLMAANEVLAPVKEELARFQKTMADRLMMRMEEEKRKFIEQEEWEHQRMLRKAAKEKTQ